MLTSSQSDIHIQCLFKACLKFNCYSLASSSLDMNKKALKDLLHLKNLFKIMTGCSWLRLWAPQWRWHSDLTHQCCSLVSVWGPFLLYRLSSSWTPCFHICMWLTGVRRSVNIRIMLLVSLAKAFLYGLIETTCFAWNWLRQSGCTVTFESYRSRIKVTTSPLPPFPHWNDWRRRVAAQWNEKILTSLRFMMCLNFVN